jgi:hypothetical protein
VGLIGSTSGIVEVRLRRPLRVRFLGIPWNCRRIRVSLEDPQGCIAALRSTGS